MPRDRVRARVGNLEFDERFGDPIVDVDTEANTVEKSTVNDEIIVQHLGRHADRVHIEGIIREHQLVTVDELVDLGEVSVRTHRWSGTAIVDSASCDYTQSYDLQPDAEFGEEWLYDVVIDLIEVDEVFSRGMFSPGVE